MTVHLTPAAFDQTRGSELDDWESVYQGYIGTGLPIVDGSSLATRLWVETIRSRSALLRASGWWSVVPSVLAGGLEGEFSALLEVANTGLRHVRAFWPIAAPEASVGAAEIADHGLTERAMTAVEEIRQVFGLTIDEACRVGGFSRRNPSHWASGKTPHHSTVRHLLEAHSFVRAGVRAWGVEGLRFWVLERVAADSDLVSLLADSQGLKALIESFVAERTEPPRARRLSDELELEPGGAVATSAGRAHLPRRQEELRRPRRTR